MGDPIVNSFAVRTWLDSPAGQSQHRILQIVCSAMMMGVASFMVVLLWIAPFKEEAKAPNWTYVWITLALASSTLGGVFALLVSKKQSTEPQILAQQAITSWIIAYALMEGPALVSLVFFMLSQSNQEKGILLGVPLVMIALMAIRYPTKSRFLEAMGASD